MRKISTMLKSIMQWAQNCLTIIYIYIYIVQNQNDFLKQLLDLLKVKPELINQDVLQIIREL